MLENKHKYWEYLKYLKEAKTKFYLHSPFVFQFYLHVLEMQKNEDTTAIQAFHQQLKKNNSPILIHDLGAKAGIYEKRISTLANEVCITPKYGNVLYRAANYFKPNLIIELGTSLGLSSAYLQAGNLDAKVITLEGAENVANLAFKNHHQMGIKKIEILVGDFQETLPHILSKYQQIDLVYIDGNHQYKPTLEYFHLLKKHIHKNTVLIFDDIYWSEGMTKAWSEILLDEKVQMSIDIYKMGFVFFNPEKLAKEHFKLLY